MKTIMYAGLMLLWAFSFAQILPKNAAAEGECLPHDGEPLYFCDPLDGTAMTGSVDKDVDGGTSVDGVGWQVGDWPDRILYDLVVPADSGKLSFYIKGISDASLLGGYVGAPEGVVNACTHYHYYEFWDDGGHGSGMSEATFYTLLRTWGGDADYFGRLRFTFVEGGSPEATDCGDPNSVYIPRLRDPAWTWDDEEHWYHVEMEFSDGSAALRVDGEEYTLDYVCPAVFQYLYIPLNPFNRGFIDALGGTVYSHVSFAGTSPETPEIAPEPEPDDALEPVEHMEPAVEPSPDPNPELEPDTPVEPADMPPEGADPSTEPAADLAPDAVGDPDAEDGYAAEGGCGCTIAVR